MTTMKIRMKSWKRPGTARKRREAAAHRATVCIVRDGRGRVVRCR
jgi:hypothetical protein